MRRSDSVVKLVPIVTAIALVVLAIGTATPVSAQSISAEQAIAAAAEAAKTLGIPFGEGATAKLGTAMLERPEWQIDFHDISTICVSEAGQVTRIVNYAALQEEYQHISVPPMPQKEAVDAATSALKAIGAAPDLVFESAALLAHGNAPKEWLVHWEHIRDGIPYERTAGAYITLDAVTGALTTLSVVPTPPAPTSMDVKVAKSDAISIALNHFDRKVGRSIGALRTTAKLEIAQPALYWSSEPVRTPRYDDPARVVWRVEVGRDTDPDQIAVGMPPITNLAYVQVDAATGEVVGDAMAGGVIGGGAKSKPAAGVGAVSLHTLLAGGIAAVLVALASLFLLARRRHSHQPKTV